MGRDTFHCPRLLQALSSLAWDTSGIQGQPQLLCALCARASPPSPDVFPISGLQPGRGGCWGPAAVPRARSGTIGVSVPAPVAVPAPAVPARRAGPAGHVTRAAACHWRKRRPGSAGPFRCGRRWRSITKSREELIRTVFRPDPRDRCCIGQSTGGSHGVHSLHCDPYFALVLQEVPGALLLPSDRAHLQARVPQERCKGASRHQGGARRQRWGPSGTFSRQNSPGGWI